MAKPFPEHSDARVRAVLQYLYKDLKIAKETEKAFRILAAHADDNEEAQRQARDGQTSLVPASTSEAHQSARGAEGETALVIIKKRKVGDANGPVADDGFVVGPAREEDPAAEICVYCSTAYTAKTNHNRVCRSHDGTLDVETESSFWHDIFESHPDPNANPYVEADGEEYRQLYPQGYEWSCCGRNGTKRGCKLRAHAAARKLGPGHLERWSRWHRAGYDERRALREAQAWNDGYGDDEGWGTAEVEVRGYLEYRRERGAVAQQEQTGPAGSIGGGAGGDDASELSVGHSDDEDGEGGEGGEDY